MLSLHTVIIFATAVYLFYYYITRTFNYWKIRNIVGPKPVPLFGSIANAALRKSNTAQIYKEIYDQYPKEKVVGIYRMTSPCLLIRDLDILKHIFVKDFDNFVERGIEFSEEFLGSNLFHAKEKIWRPLRNQLTPIFTTAKLKNMLYLIEEKGDTLIDYINSCIAKQPEQNVYAIVQRFTMSTISACAFGLDIDMDDINTMNKLTAIDKLIFTRSYFQEIDMMFPSILAQLNYSILPKETMYFFRDLVQSVLKMRNNEPSNRKDFMDLILELRQKARITNYKVTESDSDEYIELTDAIIVGQAFVFYAAGYETSATTMMFALYELAKHPDIQEKVIAEVDAVLAKTNGEVTYDTISDLTYMAQVFDETLRKYPIVEPLLRIAKSDYKVPGVDVTIPKGQLVAISGLGIHYDENIYPNPDKFDPDRFTQENVMKRHPCAYVPFGFGPRNCIGMRFAKVQSKICLLKLFSKFRVEPSERTPTQLEYDPYRKVLSPKYGMYLKIVPRHDVK